MKRTVLVVLVGLITGSFPATRCCGQGTIFFANYDGYSTMAPVTYALGTNQVPPGKAGLAVGPGFSASLYYGLGSISDPSALTLLESNQAGYPATFLGNADGDSAHGAGFFEGGELFIPDYISGPITFQVVAWANSGPYRGSNYANALLRGASPIFTLPSIAVGAPPPTAFGPDLLPFTVQFIPEPSVFALLGLGGLSLWFRPRRK